MQRRRRKVDDDTRLKDWRNFFIKRYRQYDTIDQAQSREFLQFLEDTPLCARSAFKSSFASLIPNARITGSFRYLA
jgi:hypothetical protein